MSTSDFSRNTLGRLLLIGVFCLGCGQGAVPGEIEGQGLLARAFQHELDHLDGLLFLDRLRGIKRDVIVRKIRKMTRAGEW